MLRTVWSKTLRDYRIAMLGWGGGLALLILIGFLVHASTVKAGASLIQLTQQFKFFGEPVSVDTVGGFVTWRMGNFLLVLLGIWAVLVGARMVRGEEDIAALDLLLAVPVSRTRLLLEKIAAMASALLVIGALVALGTIAGEASVKAPVDATGAALVGLNLALGAFVFGMLALFLSQLVARRGTAAGGAGALLALSYVLDGSGRTISGAAGLQRVSPFFYYGLSKPLIPRYGVNPGASAVLVGLGAALALLSIPLFARRDIGGTALPAWLRLPRATRATSAPRTLERAKREASLRTVFQRALRAQAPAVIWWLVGLGAYAAWGASIVRASEDALRQVYATTPTLSQLLRGTDLGSDAGFLSLVIFLLMPAVVAAFALTQAATWPADLESGRLELVLAAPQPRRRVLLERFAAVLVFAALAPVVVGLSVLGGARVAGLQHTGDLWAATLGMFPLEFVVAAAVFALTTWVRTSAVLGIVGAALGFSFFAEFFSSLLHVPDWVLSFSIFHAYGTPITNGPRWGAWLAVTAVAALLLGVGALRFGQRDVR
ncbi:MAG: ABC transporter permease subunit [Ktedonobacterales bacterium]|nr:ABC transporter permease subunit [Ktedonobacterales bacterium]